MAGPADDLHMLAHVSHTDLSGSMFRALHILRSADPGRIFRQPLATTTDKEFYDLYQQYITKPMDLSTITDKVKAGAYRTMAEFWEDVDLMVSNALKYHCSTLEINKVEAERIISAALKLADVVERVKESKLDRSDSATQRWQPEAYIFMDKFSCGGFIEMAFPDGEIRKLNFEEFTDRERHIRDEWLQERAEMARALAARERSPRARAAVAVAAAKAAVAAIAAAPAAAAAAAPAAPAPKVPAVCGMVLNPKYPVAVKDAVLKSKTTVSVKIALDYMVELAENATACVDVLKSEIKKRTRDEMEAAERALASEEAELQARAERLRQRREELAKAKAEEEGAEKI